MPAFLEGNRGDFNNCLEGRRCYKSKIWVMIEDKEILKHIDLEIQDGETHILMSRGLTETEATSTIVRGFLSVDIPGLPPDLRAEIDRAVDLSEEELM